MVEKDQFGPILGDFLATSEGLSPASCSGDATMANLADHRKRTILSISKELRVQME